MKRLLSVCVAVLFLIGAVASVQAADNLVLATGGTAGTYYPSAAPCPRSGTPKSRI